MIKATRFFFFDVDTSNCKAMISMIKATRFFSIRRASELTMRRELEAEKFENSKGYKKGYTVLEKWRVLRVKTGGT